MDIRERLDTFDGYVMGEAKALALAKLLGDANIEIAQLREALAWALIRSNHHQYLMYGNYADYWRDWVKHYNLLPQDMRWGEVE